MIRPLLHTLGDYRSLTLNGTQQLFYLSQLFPSMFNDKLCEQLMPHIVKMMELSVKANKNKNFLSVARTGETEQKITILISIFSEIPAASPKFIDTLIRNCLMIEENLGVSYSVNIVFRLTSTWQLPLITD